MPRFLLLAGALLPAGLFALSAPAAPVPPGTVTGKFAEPARFFPSRQYNALKGTEVGLLLPGVLPFMSQEGRSSQADAMGFSQNGASYRWIYLPVTESPQITNFPIPLGARGDRRKVYPMLGMTTPTRLKSWGLTEFPILAEVQVNDGEGSPAGETFVMTAIKRLDGTPAYPLKVPAVIDGLRKRYAEWRKERQKKDDEAIAEVGKKVLAGRAVNQPRKVEEVPYFSWLPESGKLRAHFRTKLTDASMKIVPGPVPRGPFPLPPAPPRPGGAVAFFPPPPPRDFNVQVGVQFGIVVGMAYEVDRTGKLVSALELAPQPFHQEVKGVGVPLGGPRGGPVRP